MHDDHQPAHATHAVPPGPDPLALPLLLGDVAPGRDLAGMPVTTPDGDTVVVLDHDTGDVALAEVWSLRHGTRVLPVHTWVNVVRPDGQALAQLRRALTALLDSLHTYQQVAQTDHRRLLAAVRAHAIQGHLNGGLSRAGLDDFLARFDLPPYQPRYTVTYTITGSYEVDGTPETDEDAVRRDAEDTLQLDLHRIPRLVDGSESYDVTIHAIILDDYQATPLT